VQIGRLERVLEHRAERLAPAHLVDRGGRDCEPDRRDEGALVAQVVNGLCYPLDEPSKRGHQGFDAARPALFRCLDSALVQRDEHDHEARERENRAEHAAEVVAEHPPVGLALAEAGREPIEIETGQQQPGTHADQQGEQQVCPEQPLPLLH